MIRKAYLAAVIRLYLAAPGSPEVASRADWAIAATLFDSNLPIERFAHAVRLASLRRCLAAPRENPPTETVRSLAYYRTVLLRLSAAEILDDYVQYVESRYQLLLEQRNQQVASVRRAVSQPENRLL